jgi:hypothetical protein
MEATQRKPKAEVADIIGQYGSEYLKIHPLCPVQQKAYQAIINCRTSFMGGHLQECDQCGHQRPAYNSCRNRHCPKCQYIKQVQLVNKLKAQLLAHGTFTWFSPFHPNCIKFFISTKGYAVSSRMDKKLPLFQIFL